MRIGELCHLTGATPKAVRLYESIGLLPTPARQGRYRAFDSRHLDAVRMIRQAQALGFRLKELQAVAALGPLVDVVGLDQALQAVTHKRRELAAQISALQALQQRLDDFQAMLLAAREAACACPPALDPPSAPPRARRRA